MSLISLMAPEGGDHMVLTWGRCWGILCVCVTSQGGERSLTVYCHQPGVSSHPGTSLGSAQGPGQVGGKPRPIRSQYLGHVTPPDQWEDSVESWRAVTIAVRAERVDSRDIVFIKLSILSILPCISHISSDNLIHCKKGCVLQIPSSFSILP